MEWQPDKPRSSSLSASGSHSDLNMAPANARVLVVDDDYELADVISSVFASVGYDCRLATTRREALELARTYRPHVVILDHHLDDGTGCSLARELRSSGDDLVLIAFTGSSIAVDRYTADYDACLVKPASPAILRQVVATALVDRRARSS